MWSFLVFGLTPFFTSKYTNKLRQVAGLMASTGVVAGVAVNTAHELGHRREQVERRLSRLALAQSCYGHFYVEHNHGHHIRVATPEDPASSRMGKASGGSWPVPWWDRWSPPGGLRPGAFSDAGDDSSVRTTRC